MTNVLPNPVAWPSGKRLAKELRLLLLPCSGALAVACVFFAVAWLSVGVPVFALNVAGFVFFGCLLLVAVVPFGREFQHHTLGLLLSLPLDRKRLFLEKLLAPAVAFLLLILLIGAAGLALMSNPNVRDALGLFPAGLVFAVSALCSAPLWTLSCKSTVGGAAFTCTGQFAVLAVLNYLASKAHVNEEVAMGTGLVLYGGACLWLGWRIFARFQAAESVPAVLGSAGFQAGLSVGNAAGPSESSRYRKSRPNLLGSLRSFLDGSTAALDRFLRCRPRGSVLNLFRKELRLQFPVLLLAALFALCWLLVLGLCLLLPERGYHYIFPAMLALYVPLVLLLAGSISVSEEVGFGVAGWQLTLPVPARRQWWVKLAASLAAGAGAGWLLPLVLSLINGSVGSGPQLLMHENVGPVLLWVSSLMFLLSFWAVMLTGNTVRAVLTAILALVCTAFCFGFGGWVASQLSALPAGLGSEGMTFFVSLAILIVLVLAQSLRAFRRPGSVARLRVIYPGVLLIAALAVGFLQKCVL